MTNHKWTLMQPVGPAVPWWLSGALLLLARWWLSGALLLLARCWVAVAFFRSGWLKLSAWDSTLYLFEFEYQVPLLPWQWAAWLGTATELLLPVLLLVGLFTRPVAALLFAFNMVAVISYPTLWAGGFYDHQLWGWMLLTLVVWGAGPLAWDQWRLARRA